MRAMLPPNLTRNYYEVKRLVAEGEGRELPHWHQLTGEQKRTEELDVELFRRAVLRAEEEQDLVAKFNAPPVEEPPATPTATTEAAAAGGDCGCPGCSTVRALVELIRQAKRLEAALDWDAHGSGQGDTVDAFEFVFLSSGECTALEKRAREALDQWVAAGKPLTTPGWIPASRVSLLDGFGPTWVDLERRLSRFSQRAFPRGL